MTLTIPFIGRPRKLLELFVCFALVFLADCSDDMTENPLKAAPPEETKDTIDGYYILRKEPLDTIKHYISGKWQLHYSYGGFTGHMRIDHHNAWMDFASGDSIYWVMDTVVYADAPIEWSRVNDILNDSIYMMR